MEWPWTYGMVAVALAYLVGSIPTAVWWGRLFHGVDVRDHGSRNAGATNTFRVLGPRAGVPVLLLDVAKGFLPVRVLPIWSGTEPGTDAWVLLRVLLVLATVLGHLYPLFAGFRGGKGIATSLGGILAMHPGAALICLGAFMAVFLFTRYVSLGSLVAAVSFPLALALVFGEHSELLLGFGVLLCLVVFYTHRQNIGRLLRGEENRMKLAGRSGDRA